MSKLFERDFKESIKFGIPSLVFTFLYTFFYPAIIDFVVAISGEHSSDNYTNFQKGFYIFTISLLVI